MIAVLAGGVGAARFLTGLVRVVDPADVTAVVNTGDDLVLHGLSISPDIDTVTYSLAGVANPETGWGRAGETFVTMDALERLGAPAWFRLGDRDLATHLYRTGRLADGARLHEVTAELAAAWGVRTRVLPMSDDPVRTKITLAEGGVEVDFQEYFVHRRHAVAVRGVRVVGAEDSRPAPGVLDALASADCVVIAPSNPVVSIGPILAVPGIASLLAERRDCVVAISPIIAGQAVKGPAGRLLVELGGEASATEVARRLASVAGTLVVDVSDASLAADIAQVGLRCVVAPTLMHTGEVAAELARTVLAAAGARS